MAGSGHRRGSAPGGSGDSGSGSRGATKAAPGLRLPERYALGGLIARGGMAAVWAARDRKLDREVAIKVLSEPYAADQLAVRRFKREARTAARLSGHPHVVTIYDVGHRRPSEDAPHGTPFIVMEFLSGGTVADAIRAGAVPRDEAVAWLHGAADALDHAHRRSIVHRDVKPSNFLLDDHRVLHVADFGIASLGTEDTLTASGQLLGTAAYLAPERALGQPATEASDRYSLAVAAFELLAGQRPYGADQPAALARQHIEAAPPAASSRNPDLPPALDEVLKRGMAKRPEQRWATAGELAGAVERALERDRRSGAAPVIFTRRGGGRRAAALAALAAAALVVGIAAADRLGGSRRPTAQLGRPAVAHPPPPPAGPAATPPAHRPPSASTTASPPARASAPPSADALESRGHSLMVAGDYAAAIPVLRQAISSASPAGLTYAYALYDLGRSLRLAGDPQAAIPILSRRLEIPNQTGVVRTELRLAMQAAGQAPAGQGQPSGGNAPTPHGKHDHHPHASSGGAAPAQGD